MDWDFSIERNREPLLPHIVGLFALIGLVEGGMVERLSRPLYRKVLRILRSAESAVRRLIVVMARDIVVESRPKRPRPAGLVRSRKGTFQGDIKVRAKEKARPRPSTVRPAKALRCRQGPPPPAQDAKVDPRIRFLDYDPRIPESIWPRAPAPTARSAAG